MPPRRLSRQVFKREQRAETDRPTIADMNMLFAAGVTVVLAGLAVVAYMTWKNSAPSESIAQVLHEVEHPAVGDATSRAGEPRR